MIVRFIAMLTLIWALGFGWFAIALPQPNADGKTDAVIVPTGGAGRIAHGLDILSKGKADAMLVTGVDREVLPEEFADQFDVPMKWIECCITLGYGAVDTRGNATETARWVEERKVETIRLVTTDWHMRRARGEIRQQLPPSVTIVEDAVPSEPSFYSLFLEYHKLIASRAVRLWPW